MKLLITGASGLFGSKLAKTAVNKGLEVYAGYNKDSPANGTPVLFDVSDKKQVTEAFTVSQPDVVVHAASLTDVDKCELNRELAWKINVEGATNVAAAAARNGCFLVYVSTDYVFSGDKGCYKETDQTGPVNFYGLTKLKAEEASLSMAPDCCIARTSVIYGATPAAGKINFALWLINKLSAGEKLRIVTNQWVSPTLNSSLADMVLDVVEQRCGGVFHLSGASRVSRFDFAMGIADVFDLDKSLVEPVDSAAFNWPAKRPKDSSLDVSKAQRLLQVKPLELPQALAKLKNELEKL
ncbi:MAG: dTDP-4-dehydrorhamnose reductase [Candidatus Bathyarchaeia archaeon]